MKNLSKSILLLIAVAVAMPGIGQGPVPAPKELKLLSFMKGNWDVDLKMYEGGKMVGPAKGTMTIQDSLDGMYIEARHETDMGGMKMKGLQLTSYDASKKQFMAYWFDSMGPGGLEMRGTLKGQTLTLESKMSTFPGMPGKMAFRATQSLKSANQMFFRLEMNQGKGWGKMLEGTMNRN